METKTNFEWICDHCNEELEDVSSHACFEGAENVYQTGDSNRVSTNAPISVECTSSVDKNDLLIAAVQKRPPLYDHRLPLGTRSRQNVARLWQEVLVEVSGQFNDITEVQTRWRSLRDRFVRETNWPYFSGLMFLNDVVKLRNKSNGNGEKALKQQKNYLAASDTSFDCSFNKGSAYRPPRKILPKIPAVTTTTAESSLQNASDTSYDIKKRKIDNEDLICKVLESCSERGYEPDECDAFCTRLAASLRRLPYQERAKLEIKFLQDIYDVQERLSLFKDS